MFNTDLHEWKHEWRTDHMAGNINRVEERLHERLSKFDVAFHRINHELGKKMIIICQLLQNIFIYIIHIVHLYFIKPLLIYQHTEKQSYFS